MGNLSKTQKRALEGIGCAERIGARFGHKDGSIATYRALIGRGLIDKGVLEHSVIWMPQGRRGSPDFLEPLKYVFRLTSAGRAMIKEMTNADSD